VSFFRDGEVEKNGSVGTQIGQSELDKSTQSVVGNVDRFWRYVACSYRRYWVCGMFGGYCGFLQRYSPSCQLRYFSDIERISAVREGQV
jgi:hypothetical protein